MGATTRDLSGARVFVTGATGLIGSSLVHALLSRGALVDAFVIPRPEPASMLARSGDIERVRVHVGHLEDRTSVEAAIASAAPDVVFHLGAQTLVGDARADPVRTFEVNIAGTWAVLEACRRFVTPSAVAIASSDKAYGSSARLPYVETNTLAGTEPYEASKAVTDMLAQTYAIAYGLPVRIARCGNVYGRGDFNWSRIVPGTIRSVLAGERPVLRSDGTPVRDYVSVDDIVSAYLALVEHDIAPGEAFNFSSGERLTVLDVVRLINNAVEANLEPVILGTAVGEIAEQYLDSSKAQRALGWTAQRRLAESLPPIVAWYRDLLKSDRS